MKSILHIIGLIISGLSIGYGQPPKALFDTALLYNPALRALRQEYQAELERAPQVSQLPQPELGIGGFLSPVQTRVGPQVGRLSASQRFPWFGTLQAHESLSKKEAQVKNEQIAARELEVFYQLQSAYFNLYELEASQVLTRENIALLESLKRIAESRVESGKTTLAEVLQIDLALQEYSKELEILRTHRRKPLAVINQLLNRSLDTDIDFPEELLLTDIPIEKDSLEQIIQVGHPVLKIFSQQQEVARQSIAVNTLEGKPSLGIGMDYIRVDPLSDLSPINNGQDILQVQARISLPLYRKKYQAKQREEEFRIEALESRKEQVKTLFLSQLEQAYADHESARIQYELYSQQIELTQSAVEILLTDYSNQGRGFDELLRLERDLLSYELKLLEALVKSHLAKAEIERYTGIIN